METQIQIQIQNEDKKLIREAASLMGVGHSTLARIATLEKAREIIRKNKPEEITQ